MQNVDKSNGKKIPTLYLVCTPIGNLDDFSFRAIETLKRVEVIFAEDTRRSRILLERFEIKTPLKSFHQHSSNLIVEKMLEHLAQGQSVAIISDGGMPSINDPGAIAVELATKQGFTVDVIPGPSAPSVLFSASGIRQKQYFFHGFFPREKKEAQKTLDLICRLDVAHVFFESPLRVLKTLEVLNIKIPTWHIVVGRELTKLHQEYLRGTVSEVFEELSQRPSIKGEVSFLLAQTEASIEPSKDIESINLEELKAEIAQKITNGGHTKEIAKELSIRTGIPKKQLYDLVLEILA
ncbi:MAG: 16S rRNA (cytidine(1402)-2'-O)-methyltransferase [Bacteriovoracia bacterium]